MYVTNNYISILAMGLGLSHSSNTYIEMENTTFECLLRKLDLHVNMSCVMVLSLTLLISRT